MTQSGVARWTNPSVLRFAADDDPIEKMEQRVRGLVLEARDAGWTGPPFSPVSLARFLNIPVDPSSSVIDARTVASDRGPTIQYNPQQSRARARFSIAHEIAHTFFEDVAEATRHRGGDPTVSDDWQLEMLCNLAAAEMVMPLGSLPSREDVPPIEQLLKERLQFDVSVEAYLMRVVKVATSPMTMFVASPRRTGRHISYQIDYAVSSAAAPRMAIQSKTIPANSVLLHCTAIGATSHGTEEWLSGTPVRIEAVGIPGYPGSTLPRVVALVRHSDPASEDVVHVIHGNVLEPRPFPPQIICQLTNDKATRWGGGVAKQTAQKHPAAEYEYSVWIKTVPRRDRLGEVHYSKISEDQYVASLIAQEGFGQSSETRLRYSALDRALQRLSRHAKLKDASVHMPKIGTGAAGGDWDVVEGMIRTHFAGLRQGVWVYEQSVRQDQFELSGL